MVIELSLLGISIACYSVRELQAHGKLRWMREGKLVRGFWDDDSYLRKYKLTPQSTVISAPQNWYYKTFKIKYKERFPLSATFLVSLTDGYHMCQSISFLSLSGCVSLLSGISFWYVWLGVLLCHFITYKLLSK